MIESCFLTARGFLLWNHWMEGLGSPDTLHQYMACSPFFTSRSVKRLTNVGLMDFLSTLRLALASAVPARLLSCVWKCTEAQGGVAKEIQWSSLSFSIHYACCEMQAECKKRKLLFSLKRFTHTRRMHFVQNLNLKRSREQHGKVRKQTTNTEREHSAGGRTNKESQTLK